MTCHRIIVLTSKKYKIILIIIVHLRPFIINSKNNVLTIKYMYKNKTINFLIIFRHRVK